MIRTEGLSSAAFRFFESKKVGDDLNGIGTLSEIKVSEDGKVITFKIGLESYQINKAIAKPRRYSNGSFSTNSAKFDKLISEWQASGAPAPAPAPPPPPIPTSAATIPVLRRQSLTTSASLRIAEPKVSPVAPARAGSVVTKAAAAIPTVAKDVPPRPLARLVPRVDSQDLRGEPKERIRSETSLKLSDLESSGLRQKKDPQFKDYQIDNFNPLTNESTTEAPPVKPTEPTNEEIAQKRREQLLQSSMNAFRRTSPIVKPKKEVEADRLTEEEITKRDAVREAFNRSSSLIKMREEQGRLISLRSASRIAPPLTKPKAVGLTDEEITRKDAFRKATSLTKTPAEKGGLIGGSSKSDLQGKKTTREIFTPPSDSKLEVTKVEEAFDVAGNLTDFYALVGKETTFQNFEFERLKTNKYKLKSVAKKEGFEFLIIKNGKEQLVKLAENGDFSTDSGDITEAEFLELINHLSVEIQSELESRMPKSPSPIAAQSEPESRMPKNPEVQLELAKLRSDFIAEEASTQFSQSLGENTIGKLVIDSSFISPGKLVEKSDAISLDTEESKRQFLKTFFKNLSKKGIEISIFKTDPTDTSMDLADFQEEGLSINVTNTLADDPRNSLIIGKGGILTYKRPGVADDLTLPLQNVNISFLSTFFVRKMTQGLTSLVDMSKPKAPPIPVTQDNSVATSDNVADRDDAELPSPLVDDGERASAKGTTEASQRKHDRLDLPTEVITKATQEALASKLPSSNSEEPKQSEDSLVNMPHLPPIVTSQHRADVDQLSEFVSPASSIPISILSPISDGLKSSLFVPSSSPHPVKSKRFEFQYEVLKHSIHGEKVTVNYRSDRGDAKSQDEKQIDVWKEEVNAAAAVAKKLDDKYGLKDNETDNSIKSGLMRITYQASIVAGGIGGRDSLGNIIPCSRGRICVDQNGDFVGYRNRGTGKITNFSGLPPADGVEIGDEFENGAEYAKHLLEKAESYFTQEAWDKINAIKEKSPLFPDNFSSFISKKFQDQACLLEGKPGNKRRLTYYTPEGMGVALEMIRTGEGDRKTRDTLEEKPSMVSSSYQGESASSPSSPIDLRTSFQNRFGSKLSEKKKALQSNPESWEESVLKSRQSVTPGSIK